MNEQTLNSLIRKSLNYSQQFVSFAWHGGEPTLSGLNFYNKIIELQNKFGQNHIIGNSIQTNGLLIDYKFAKFFADYNWLVGISLDGPKEFHDKYRKNKNNIGSWKKVNESAKLLINEGVATNVLCCITDVNVRYPDVLYDYYKDLGFQYIQFIPVAEKSSNGCEMAHYSVNPIDYGRFLCRIFDRWYADFVNNKLPPSIRFIEDIFKIFIGLDASNCMMKDKCGDYLVIEHNGDVYCCDYFVTNETRIGNINNYSIDELLKSTVYNKFVIQKNILLAECTKCKWLKFCYGGCPKYRNLINGKQGKNYFCSAIIIFLKYSEQRFLDIANLYEKNAENDQKIFDASKYVF